MFSQQNRFLLVFTLAFLVFSAVSLKAQESTKVVVRAVSKDAKFIGSSMGGVKVKIENAETGAILAEGLTEGSTGDTKKLVVNPKKRYEKLSTEGAAKFTAHLNIDEPTFVTISAASTYREEQEVTSSTQMWLIPGMDITGDGVILEIPGFIVDIIDIQPYKKDKLGAEFKVKVVMMCGCPTEPDGLWDSSEFKMKALIKKDGKVLQTVPLSFSGETNIYDGNFSVEQPGDYAVSAVIFDPRTANSGIATKSIILE